MLGWGSTYGPITAAVRRLRRDGERIAQAHLRHLNPLPANLGEVLKRYDKVVIPEMNLGQLATLVRARYLVDAHSHTQINGMPFKAEQLAAALKQAMHTTHSAHTTQPAHAARTTQPAQPADTAGAAQASRTARTSQAAARPHQAKEAIDG